MSDEHKHAWERWGTYLEPDGYEVWGCRACGAVRFRKKRSKQHG